VDTKTLFNPTNDKVDTEKKQLKERFIHIPQGKCGRFSRSTKDYLDIDGLHTDEFSTCNILLFIGQDKFSLAHVDARVHLDVEQEIQWVGHPNKIIIISRPEEVSQIIQKQIVNTLNKANLFNIEKINIAEENETVIVRLPKCQENVINPQIECLPIAKAPEDLLHHPLEEKFQIIQKIEQVIGIQALQETQKINKTRVIFDGATWQPIPQSELEIDSSHPSTKVEMQGLQSKRKFIDIAVETFKVINKNHVTGKVPFKGDMQKTATNIAVHLESYLNKGVDAEAIMLNNLKELIDDYKPVAKEDSQFKANFKKQLSEKNITVDALNQMVTKFEKELPKSLNTHFKDNFFDMFEMLNTHYHARIKYQKLNTANAALKQQLRPNNTAAKQHLDNQQYQEALNLFSQGVHNTTSCCLANAPEIAMAHYNYGKTLYKQNQYEKALFFLTTAANLVAKYPKQQFKHMTIESTKQAVLECQEKLNAASTQKQEIEKTNSGIENSSSQHAYAPVFSTISTTNTDATAVTISNIQTNSPNPF